MSHVKIIILTLLCLVLMPVSAWAMDVTLQWDANWETDLAGYKVYYDTNSGAPYSGTGAAEGNSPITMTLAQDENPDPATVEFTVHGLNGTVVWYFVVTAYDSEVPPQESIYSNEVFTEATAPGPPGQVQGLRIISQ